MQYIENGIVQLDNSINTPRVRIRRPARSAAVFVEIVQFSTKKRAAAGSEKMHNTFTSGRSRKLQAVTFFLWSDPKKESNQRKKDRGRSFFFGRIQRRKNQRRKIRKRFDHNHRTNTTNHAEPQHAEPSRFTTLNHSTLNRHALPH